MITQVEIPKEEIQEWEGLLSRGDIGKLMALTNRSRTTIYDIFKLGKCDPLVYARMSGFFKTRKEIVNPEDQD